MADNADIGVVGLAVMGQNLILNMNDHGFKVTAYNRTASKTDEFLAGPAKGTNITGAHSLKALIDSLARPRKVMLMVRAGAAVDAIIQQLITLLEKGDLIIDGGNSNFTDTERRLKYVEEHGLLYIGTGVSGGEEGARHGPSIMPGGHANAWPLVKNLFQSISAKTKSGDPCCDWVGDGGAGHFVKMVHNGIEYGDMQLICEAYDFMQHIMGMSNAEMQQVFSDWDKGDLDSYLIEITANILGFKNHEGYVLDTILDKAGQKGTGKWTGINAMELGIPLTLIGEAVFARCLSAFKEERVRAEQVLSGPAIEVLHKDREEWIKALGDALLAAKIISYTQGYMLMAAAATEYQWKLQYGAIAQMWRGGCIIRSAFLDDIKNAFDKDSKLPNLLLDDYFKNSIDNTQANWRKIVAKAINSGLPIPAMSSALSFYDGYRTARLPANLLQAQRDYFGAHTYERLDQPGKRFHTDWTGDGGDVSSTSYTV